MKSKYRTNVVRKRSRLEIARTFAASLMSDTKWRKLFIVLDRPDLSLEHAIVKFIDREEEVRTYTPDRSSLYPPRPYIDASIGPFALRDIEWIEFPAVAEIERPSLGPGRLPPRTVTQDIDRAQRLIETLGQYPMTRTDRGLRITGHVRSGDEV